MFITRTGFCVGKFTSSISLGPASSRSYSRVNCYFFGRRTHITELNSSRCHNFLTLAPQVDHPRLRVRSKDIFLSQRKSKADKVKNENSLCTETIMQYSVHHDAQKQLFSIELSSGRSIQAVGPRAINIIYTIQHGRVMFVE